MVSALPPIGEIAPIDPIELEHNRSLRNLLQRTISIHRGILDQDQFDKQYGLIVLPPLSPKQQVENRLRKTGEKCANLKRWARFASSLVPVTQWLPRYKWRENFVADLISGLTVGVMNIPQGMAYAMLAQLPLVFGLYMSVFPSFIYFFFGTSRHLAIGVFAIISLMVGTCMDKVTTSLGVQALLGDNATNQTMGFVCSYGSNYDYAMCAKISAAQDLALITGLFSFAFGLLRCGFVGDLLSDQLTQGLTTGAAVQIGSSQVAHLFGIKGLPKTSGVLGVPKFYYQLFYHIAESNYVTVILAAVACIILLIHKIKTGPMFLAKFRVPLPLELICVIIATAISTPLQLNRAHDVAVVGAIPTGLPKPTAPTFGRLDIIIPDAFVIAIITFALQISIAKIYGKKHGYNINPNQEWFAIGFFDTISSFFHCWCAGASIPRTAVQEGTGGKTQIAGVVASILMVIVLLVAASLFSPLPNCILAAIIVTSLVAMLKQVQVLPTLWRQSKCDFWIFVTACIGVILLDIAFGLLAAVCVSFVVLLYRTIWPHWRLLGHIRGTNEYEAPDVYSAALEVPQLKIFRFEAPLFYANVTSFKEKLYKATVNPMEALKKRTKQQKRALKASQQIKTASSVTRIGNKLTNCLPCRKRVAPMNVPDTAVGNGAVDVEANSMPKVEQRLDIRVTAIRSIIIDCSSISFIDYPGCTALKEVCQDYEKIDISIFLASCNVGVREMLARVHFHEYIPKTAIFISVHDAVLALQHQEKMKEAGIDPTTLRLANFTHGS